MTLGQLQEEVLELTSDDRARLAEWIIAGLELEAELEREWLEELRGLELPFDGPFRSRGPIES
jgi:hypothetical protein